MAAEDTRALLDDSAEDLYEHAPCGYLSTRPDGTILKLNATFEAWTGLRREALVGRRRFPELLTAGGRIYHETHLAPLLQMQGSVSGIALELACAGGRRLPVLVNCVLKRGADGEPLLIRTTVFDATQRKEYERELLRARDAARDARDRTERLQQITAVLAGALTLADLGAGVLDALAASTGAGRAVLAEAGEDPGALEVLGGTGAWEDEGRAALAAGAPRFGAHHAALPLVVGSRAVGLLWLGFDAPQAFGDAQRAFLVACAGQAAQALERARLYARTAEAARRSAFHAEASRSLDEVQGYAERRERLLELIAARLADAATLEDGGGDIAARLGAAATAAVQRALATGAAQTAPGAAALPLRARGRVIGALTLVRHGGRFDAGELPFLSDLADRAGLALENARVYEREHDVAHILQQSLLAITPPADPRVDVAADYRPAIESLDVGGDWYDAFETGDGRIAIVIGDVVGRGIVAASAMGQLRSAVRALAGAGLSPAALLERLDAFVEQIETAHWATVVYAELDLATGVLCHARAGHPPPLLAEPGRPARFLWEGLSTPLGVGGERGEEEITLAPGSRLLLYTDGLVERRGVVLDRGLDQLATELEWRRAAPLPVLVGQLTDAMLLDQAHRDDVCLLCVAYSGTHERSGL